ncbi:MAG TPA: polysaccharide deacetylase family protein [Vicinamibacteria bacterium]
MTFPAVLVGVDTEADDQWSAAGRRLLSVRNAERLPALQALCDALGVRPTYLVTHEMATRAESARVLRDLLATGRCEIGAHLHPWSSPPFRPEDQDGRYPHQLPTELLRRQLAELTDAIAQAVGRRPTSYRAGRHGFDERSLAILEELGYTVDTSVDPLFNERKKGGPAFAGAPLWPYRPDYRDVRRPGAARILEIPVTAATTPPLPKALERLYASLPPIPYRGALRRLGLRAVWLRPSYTALPDMLDFATRLARRRVPCFNILFHSSELLPGGSPYTPDQASVDRFVDHLRRVLEHLTGPLAGVGRTYAEFAAAWSEA